MASTVPPIAQTASTSIPAQYALPDFPSVPSANPDREPMDAFRLAVAKIISEAWGEPENIAAIFDGVDTGKKGVDLALAVVRFKKGKDMETAARKVVDSFQPNSAVSTCVWSKPFLNFTFNTESFAYHVLRQITVSSLATRQNPSSFTQAYGTADVASGKHMLVDFSSPNIAKPFHAGHLRSTIIGAVIANLHEAMGWKVTRLNYLGDWGTQYGLLSLGFDRYGNEEALKANPIMHLFDVYVKINQDNSDDKEKFNSGQITDPETTVHAQAKRIFKAMEDGEPTALAQWSRFRDLSIEKLKETYAKLNIHFDVYWGESQVSKESMERAVRICKEKELTCIDDGALLVDLEAFKLGRTIITKRDGTSIYLTRDLGGAFDKWNKYKFDKHVYVVQAAQTLHFKQLYKTLELMGEEYAGRFEHVSFGLVNGMSTRKGTVKFLDDILDEATDVMHEQMRSNEVKYAQVENPELTSEIIGSTAVKIQDMSGKRINDYNFDIRRCTSFEGDFGPFIQYSHVRLSSIERKNPNVPIAASVDEIDLSILDDPKVKDILYHLALYPTAVRNAYQYSEPSTLVNWCFRVSHLVGSAWESVKVSGASEEEQRARLFFYVQIREVLASAMKLLSLTPIERM